MFRRFLRWCAHALVPWDKIAGYAIPHLLVACLVGGILALSGAFAVHRLLSHGAGYKPAPLPLTKRIAGAPVPSHASLNRWLVRIHNQDDGNSCVAHSASTIEEVVQAEHGHRIGFSSGYIYDQINGGVDRGSSYEDAFHVLTSQGDAPLSAFHYDGFRSDYWVQPDARAVHAAAPYRFKGWISVAPSDVYSIEYAISHGVPVAFAMPILSSFYSQFGDGSVPTITGQWGTYEFDHSQTLIGYDSFGPFDLNSWGPSWGGNGRAHLSWGFIARWASAVIIATPPTFHVVPAKPPKPFPIKKWQHWALHNHHRLFPWKHGSHLTWAASIWRHHAYLYGKKPGDRFYAGKPGFDRYPFERGVVYAFPKTHRYKIVWKHKR